MQRQCLGPGCTESCIKGSKYCSDACGINLAKARLLHYARSASQRQNWTDGPCSADVVAREKLKELESQIGSILKKLEELDERQKKLDQVVERASKLAVGDDDLPPVPDAVYDSCSASGQSDNDSGFVVTCKLCGLDVPIRSFSRHTERCYSKYESKSAFGSNVPSKMKGIFCDAFDISTGIYCKRLKSMCPEHIPADQQGTVEVDGACGRPLVADFFSAEQYGVCTLRKSQCAKHSKWEKMCSAEIELMRLKQHTILEELYERKDVLSQSIARRKGLLGLLLHPREMPSALPEANRSPKETD